MTHAPEALKRSVATAATVELRLKAPPSPRLFQQLETLHGVEGVLAEENGVKVLTSARDGLVPQLIAKVGSGLLDLSVSETTLEKVFISLTGRRLRDWNPQRNHTVRVGRARWSPAPLWQPSSRAVADHPRLIHCIDRSRPAGAHAHALHVLLRTVLNPLMFVFVFT